MKLRQENGKINTESGIVLTDTKKSNPSQSRKIT